MCLDVNTYNLIIVLFTNPEVDIVDQKIENGIFY